MTILIKMSRQQRTKGQMQRTVYFGEDGIHAMEHMERLGWKARKAMQFGLMVLLSMDASTREAAHIEVSEWESDGFPIEGRAGPAGKSPGDASQARERKRA